MIVLGLTGSIAMGKSTTAAMFEREGAAVYDADAAVHMLYGPGGPAGVRLAALFPGAVAEDGAVRRDVLRGLLAERPDRLPCLEAEVFPLLAAHRQAFLATAALDRRLAVLDIPLMYETGTDTAVDAVVVATATADVQRARVLARPGMDKASFALLSARQMPDVEKRRRADFLVFTDRGFGSAAEQVRQIVGTVLAPNWFPPRKTRLANEAR